MTFSRRFYILAAGCSFVSAGTTLALIFLPDLYGPIEDFDARIRLVESSVYMIRAWTYFLHPFVVLTAALGVAVVLARRAAGASVLGLLGFLLWAFTEAGQQALTLVAFQRWARTYATATAPMREALELQIATYDAIWDAMFLLLLIGFLIGNAAFGTVLITRAGFDRVLGILYLAVSVLTLTNVSQHVGGPALPSDLAGWLYPVVQPVTRALIGVWLLRAPARFVGMVVDSGEST